ncbi:MAG: hypothetical protein Fur009_5100 [Candidatus Microgenomates bacterium]
MFKRYIVTDLSKVTGKITKNTKLIENAKIRDEINISKYLNLVFRLYIKINKINKIEFKNKMTKPL